jgi:hypothetical protein
MTTERDPDSEPTVEIIRPVPSPATEIGDVDQDFDSSFDPEQTLVREDWESTVIRRVAPHVAAVQDEAADDDAERFGWESEGLRRLSKVVQIQK